MVSPVEINVFDRVGRDFLVALCKRRHFEPTDAPAERHGSWEWTFRKQAGDLDRFVSVAFTSLPRAVPDSDWYAMTESFTADDLDEIYVRPRSHA